MLTLQPRRAHAMQSPGFSRGGRFAIALACAAVLAAPASGGYAQTRPAEPQPVPLPAPGGPQVQPPRPSEPAIQPPRPGGPSIQPPRPPYPGGPSIQPPRPEPPRPPQPPRPPYPGGPYPPAPPQHIGALTLHSSTNFRGASSRAFMTGAANLANYNFNDRALSVRIPRGTRWQLCQDAHFRGRCITLTSSVSDLRRYGLAHSVSSIRRY